MSPKPETSIHTPLTVVPHLSMIRETLRKFTSPILLRRRHSDTEQDSESPKDEFIRRSLRLKQRIVSALSPQRLSGGPDRVQTAALDSEDKAIESEDSSSIPFIDASCEMLDVLDIESELTSRLQETCSEIETGLADRDGVFSIIGTSFLSNNLVMRQCGERQILDSIWSNSSMRIQCRESQILDSVLSNNPMRSESKECHLLDSDSFSSSLDRSLTSSPARTVTWTSSPSPPPLQFSSFTEEVIPQPVGLRLDKVREATTEEKLIFCGHCLVGGLISQVLG